MQQIVQNTLLLNGRLYTLNSAAGWRLRHQPVITLEGKEYRSWNPYRSKLAAYILCGGNNFRFAEASKILYIGASYGTTVSHLADINPQASIYAVEFAREPFQSLLKIAALHPGIIPILEDAGRPERYAAIVDAPELIIQDVTQGDMLRILRKNMNSFHSVQCFYLSIKAGSIDSSRESALVISGVAEQLEREYGAVEITDISRYEKGHAIAVHCRKA